MAQDKEADSGVFAFGDEPFDASMKSLEPCARKPQRIDVRIGRRYRGIHGPTLSRKIIRDQDRCARLFPVSESAPLS
jgi:hypothetical protein